MEPASAARVAGLLHAAEQGLVDPGQRIVCTVTGNGLKDPDWAVAGAPQPHVVPIDAEAAAEAARTAGLTLRPLGPDRWAGPHQGRPIVASE